MSLYRAYAAERNSGKNHAQIVADGIFGKDVHEYGLLYSQEQAVYIEHMNRKANCEGDLDIFGRPMKAGS